MLSFLPELDGFLLPAPDAALGTVVGAAAGEVVDVDGYGGNCDVGLDCIEAEVEAVVGTGEVGEIVFVVGGGGGKVAVVELVVGVGVGEVAESTRMRIPEWSRQRCFLTYTCSPARACHAATAQPQSPAGSASAQRCALAPRSEESCSPSYFLLRLQDRTSLPPLVVVEYEQLR
jgi:hypothetical protein